MSILDMSGHIMCPECKTKQIPAWYFDCDCRGNPSISGADACLNCGFLPTKEFIATVYSSLNTERDKS